MPRYVEHARACGALLSEVDGVEVTPNPPQTPMMHVHLRTDADALRASATRLAKEDKLWVGLRSAPSALPGWRRIEFTVGDATLEFAPERVRDIVASLVSRTAG
jgi:hypothetical protein